MFDVKISEILNNLHLWKKNILILWKLIKKGDMMKRAEIQKFFLLENYPKLFDDALCPRSCGGTAKFEQLALYGDRVLDIHLFDYLIEIEERKLKGDITKRRGTIHHWYSLKVFADDLGIPDICPPSRPFANNDWKEIVEALIGAAFKVNGLKSCSPIIKKFVDFTQKRQTNLRERGEFDMSMDYISELNNLPNDVKNKLYRSDLSPKTDGPDHRKTYQYDQDIIFDEMSHRITTGPQEKIDIAHNEAAYHILGIIYGNNTKSAKNNISVSQEKTVYPTVSIDDYELIFRKPVSKNESMEVKQNTDELLIDWVNRKAKKNVFGMLILLSARLDTVSGASWVCEFSSGVLALINLQLGEQEFFAMGFGSSKSQARKAAGKELLMKVDLIEWLEKKHQDYKI